MTRPAVTTRCATLGCLRFSILKALALRFLEASGLCRNAKSLKGLYMVPEVDLPSAWDFPRPLQMSVREREKCREVGQRNVEGQ